MLYYFNPDNLFPDETQSKEGKAPSKSSFEETQKLKEWYRTHGSPPQKVIFDPATGTLKEVETW